MHTSLIGTCKFCPLRRIGIGVHLATHAMRPVSVRVSRMLVWMRQCPSQCFRPHLAHVHFPRGPLPSCHTAIRGILSVYVPLSLLASLYSRMRGTTGCSFFICSSVFFPVVSLPPPLVRLILIPTPRPNSSYSKSAICVLLSGLIPISSPDNPTNLSKASTGTQSRISPLSSSIRLSRRKLRSCSQERSTAIPIRCIRRIWGRGRRSSRRMFSGSGWPGMEMLPKRGMG